MHGAVVISRSATLPIVVTGTVHFGGIKPATVMDIVITLNQNVFELIRDLAAVISIERRTFLPPQSACGLPRVLQQQCVLALVER